MAEIESSVAPEADPQHNSRLAEFHRRVAYIADNYRAARAAVSESGSLNEGLRRLTSTLGKVSSGTQTRAHPEIELLINAKAQRRAQARQGSSSMIECEDVASAAADVAQGLRAVRGRPADLLLEHHVQGMIVLCEWATGTPVTASLTTNSEYAPQLTSPGAQVIEVVFRGIDPSISRTTLVNIIRKARATGATNGKTFWDYFPFYGGSIDPVTGMPQPGPGCRLVSFEWARPIYLS